MPVNPTRSLRYFRKSFAGAPRPGRVERPLRARVTVYGMASRSRSLPTSTVVAVVAPVQVYTARGPGALLALAPPPAKRRFPPDSTGLGFRQAMKVAILSTSLASQG
ncbi:hypothetical protein GWK47_039522 [Chionoecetes opilio]|uniref:Uncharacterized protein n=1 Tax=Chionoecetes opilio TaxID=41210 RepID=A0A8J4YBI4_CHIOP|nr:hypothetical protein GWK47_039522 [Chionoecetes opilio]